MPAQPGWVARVPEKILAVLGERSERPVALPAAPARLNKPECAVGPIAGDPAQLRHHECGTYPTACPAWLCAGLTAAQALALMMHRGRCPTPGGDYVLPVGACAGALQVGGLRAVARIAVISLALLRPLIWS